MDDRLQAVLRATGLFNAKENILKTIASLSLPAQQTGTKIATRGGEFMQAPSQVRKIQDIPGAILKQSVGPATTFVGGALEDMGTIGRAISEPGYFSEAPLITKESFTDINQPSKASIALAALGVVPDLGDAGRVGLKALGVTEKVPNMARSKQLGETIGGVYDVYRGGNVKGKRVVNMNAKALISHEGAPDKATVNKYVNKLFKGEKLKPLKVIQEKGGFGIEDGKHRFEAYKIMGIDKIPVEIIDSPKSRFIQNPKTGRMAGSKSAKGGLYDISTVKPTKEFGHSGRYEVQGKLRVDDLLERNIKTPEFRDQDVVAEAGRKVKKPIVVLIKDLDDPNSPIDIVDGWHRVRQAIANNDEFIPVKYIVEPEQLKNITQQPK